VSWNQSRVRDASEFFNEIDVKEPLQIAALNASIGRIATFGRMAERCQEAGVEGVESAQADQRARRTSRESQGHQQPNYTGENEAKRQKQYDQPCSVAAVTPPKVRPSNDCDAQDWRHKRFL
jgi:hypothetical protein